jgi:hypothetical protein
MNILLLGISYMKLISKSHLSKTAREAHQCTAVQNKRRSLGYCCDLDTASHLNATHFTKRNTDPNIRLPNSLASSPLLDTTTAGHNSTNSNLDSLIEPKEWKVQLCSKILSISEILGDKRGLGTRVPAWNEQAVCRRQKL